MAVGNNLVELRNMVRRYTRLRDGVAEALRHVPLQPHTHSVLREYVNRQRAVNVGRYYHYGIKPILLLVEFVQLAAAVRGYRGYVVEAELVVVGYGFPISSTFVNYGHCFHVALVELHHYVRQPYAGQAN